MIQADAAKFFPVETGLTQDDKVEVVNGLKLGDVVITRGSNLIKDGDRVRVQPQGQAGQGGQDGGSQSRQGAANPASPGQQPSGQQPQQQSTAPQAGQKRAEGKQ